jgi:hypothetical protein
MPDETVKVTFEIRPTAKSRLATLKHRLRSDGYQESESSLVERLLSPNFILALEDDVKRNPRRRTTT